ncbi:CIA30 family protein [Sulfitobacter sp. HNIBRBA3233]|uniref:CIA30 family protein n=1 Tax=Sulfitobacter marinivivus TaxID=3158558 RepID=UPI0032DEDE96
MRKLDPDWEYVADAVMGGVSQGALRIEDVSGRRAAHLQGDVSLENDGGFIQIAFDLDGDHDAAAYAGIVLWVHGNGAEYEMRLRTTALSRPWQSFRAVFTAPADWTEVRLPFAGFEPNKTEASFDPAQLRRIGVLAYGREMQADIAVSDIGFYR